jgi:hypothetical protein
MTTPAVAAAWSNGTAFRAALVMCSVPSRIAVIAADRIIIDSVEIDPAALP